MLQVAVSQLSLHVLCWVNKGMKLDWVDAGGTRIIGACLFPGQTEPGTTVCQAKITTVPLAQNYLIKG